MSEFVTQRDHRGHTIKIHVRRTSLGELAWGYRIASLKHKAYGRQPASSYDEVLTAALDEGRRHIDAFEDLRIDTGTSTYPQEVPPRGGAEAAVADG